MLRMPEKRLSLQQTNSVTLRFELISEKKKEEKKKKDEPTFTVCDLTWRQLRAANAYMAVLGRFDAKQATEALRFGIVGMCQVVAAEKFGVPSKTLAGIRERFG
jgi:hypothetical protein